MEADAVEPSARVGPISLRVSATDRCRFRCVYCTPAEGVKRFAPAEILSCEEIVRFVRLLKRHGRLAKVHITGGEPLDRRDIVKLVGMLAAEGIDDLAMTTNGQRLSELAPELKRAGLRRVNVSLNTLDPQVFRELTGGGELGPTLAGIDAALAAGLSPVKGNMTVLRGINDHEVGNLVQWGIARRVEVRFIELMPIGPAAPRHRDWFVPAKELLERLRARFDLAPLPRPRGRSCHEYRIAVACPSRPLLGHAGAAGALMPVSTDGLPQTGGSRACYPTARWPTEDAGLIGIISPCTQPFCADCARLRLTAGGGLVGCLARNSRTSVLSLLRADGPTSERAILAKVRAVMRRKRTDDVFSGNHCMVKTGG